MSDQRFTRLRSDPRFRSLEKHKNKVVVDGRFSSVFSRPKKQTKIGVGHPLLRLFTNLACDTIGRVDKYGRWLSDSQENENLRRFYRLGSENQLEFSTGPDYARGEVLLGSSDEEDGSGAPGHPQSSDDENNDDVVTLGPDAVRHVPVTQHEDAEVDLDEDEFAGTHMCTVLHQKTASGDDQESSLRTRRIAIVDLDWDYVRAIHLYKIFTSVVTAVGSSSSRSNGVSAPSARGKVLSVRVYPSKFGLERMTQEDNGPPLLMKQSMDDAEGVNERTIYETGDVDEYDEDALRKYQLQRMRCVYHYSWVHQRIYKCVDRYYYAIVECDTIKTASYLYSELQGAELERSANVLNLSFVPDDMTFEEEHRSCPLVSLSPSAY
jgi:hypothetical protein